MKTCLFTTRVEVHVIVFYYVYKFFHKKVLHLKWQIIFWGNIINFFSKLLHWWRTISNKYRMSYLKYSILNNIRKNNIGMKCLDNSIFIFGSNLFWQIFSHLFSILSTWEGWDWKFQYERGISYGRYSNYLFSSSKKSKFAKWVLKILIVKSDVG